MPPASPETAQRPTGRGAISDWRPGAASGPCRIAGFTMVELIVVILLAGILAAIGVSRFFNRAGYDADAFTEQTRTMLRYAQKLAIAQNRPVYVQASSTGLALCYASGSTCAATSLVPAPSGSNSGSAATRTRCVVGNTYVANWYCEAPPAGSTFTVPPAAANSFYFNGLGRPYMAGDVISAASDASSFTAMSFAITAEGSTRTVTLAQETGYVQ
jgi:MSHA pilin protein MshC